MAGLVDLPFNSFLGGLAVTFFFVLSGFLITSLLLNEKKIQGVIRTKRFLSNRILRIWPLYYVVLVLGYAVSIFLLGDTPIDPLKNGFILNALLLPNVAFVSGLLPEILIQLWSVGTEEQFYLVWPFLLNRMNRKMMVRVFMAIVVFWLVARGIFRLLGEDYDWWNMLLFRTRMDCMAIGGVAALVLLDREGEGQWKERYRWVFEPITGWIAGIAFVGLLYVSYRFKTSLYQLYAVLSAILILRVIVRPVAWLERRIPRYLGKVSYGIYLLQHFVLFFLFRVWIARGATPFTATMINSRAGGIFIYLLAVLSTVALAGLSYTYFESSFLKRKR